MQVDLNDEQTEVLRSVLESTVRELSYEIASADLPTFRQSLRHRREIVQEILAALRETISTP
jgi:vacuolar-type H+-ATPase subunit E/Vma4